jgi:hypothetical protein
LGQEPLPLIRPMLAVNSLPFDSDLHLFEIKWDGYRGLLYLDGNTALRSRNLLDLTGKFPELGRLHQKVARKPAILDGEIVVFEKGKPSFARLQARGRLINPQRISRVSVESPAVYVAFDVLYADGKNVMEHPLRERKTLLAEMVNPGAEIIVPDFILQNGRSFYDACVSRGLEGVVAKKLDSVYLPGRRSIYWQKFRHTLEAELVICGYQAGASGRSLGSLVLGGYRKGKLIDLINERRIGLICPGHGWLIPGDKAVAILQKQLRIAGNLTNIREWDLAAFREVSQYALEMLADVNDMVAIIAGRLYYLAYYLEELGEPAEARKYREFISLEAIEELLDEYDHCAAALQKGEIFDMVMVLKTTRLLEKIQALLNEGKLELIMDKYFMRRANRLFSDFFIVSSGRPLDITLTNGNINELLGDLLAEVKRKQYNEDYILEVLDDDELYLEALATRIAFQPVLQEVKWSFSPGDVVPVRLNPERFAEAYTGLLEDIATLDVPDLRIATALQEQGVVVRTDSINGIPAGVFNEKRFDAHRRRIELAGGQLQKVTGGGKVCFEITFSAAAR